MDGHRLQVITLAEGVASYLLDGGGQIDGLQLRLFKSVCRQFGNTRTAAQVEQAAVGVFPHGPDITSVDDACHDDGGDIRRVAVAEGGIEGSI